MASTDQSKESPLRSLSSFKSEIPGADGLGAMDAKKSKSFHQYLDTIINGAAFLSVIVFLVLVICGLVSAELLISLTDLIPDSASKDDVLVALSATCLAILALFVIEVTVRLISMGTYIKEKKMEIFDIVVVYVTFICDLAILATGEQNDTPASRAVAYLIALRFWRICGVYSTGVKKAREKASSELQMEKYARNQAEIQADALQAQCDQQLKEIAHLRDFMRQHSLDSPKMGFPPDYRHRYTIAVDFDKADTVRVNDRVNSESSLASAIATFDSTNELSQPEKREDTLNSRGQYSDHQNSESSSPSLRPTMQQNALGTTPVSSTIDVEGHNNLAFEIEVGEEAREHGGGGGGGRDGDGDGSHSSRDPGGLEGITNPAFEDDDDDHSGEENEAEPRSDGMLEDGVIPSNNNNADDEAQLRMELEEIRKLSDAALLEEFGGSSITKEINGVPTTSL